MSAPCPPRRGRPPIYLDDADRHRAFRERRREALDLGDAARDVLRAPNALLIERIAQVIIAKSSDRDGAVDELRRALEAGIAAGRRGSQSRTNL